jgi:hypothetical protein
MRCPAGQHILRVIIFSIKSRVEWITFDFLVGSFVTA